MNSNRFLLLFIFIFPVLFYNCERLDLKREAIVETSSDIEFSVTEAKISGRIIDAGEDLLEYGHCWNTEPHPTIKNNRTIYTDAGKNEWESIIEGISPHVNYYVRAYALDKDLTETYSEEEPDFIIENVWIQLQPFPGEARQQAFGFSIGSKGYFGGGRRWHEGSFIVFNDFWEYNTESGVWTRRADFPSESSIHSAFVINDKGYVYQNLTNELYEYDPSVNQWFPKKGLPVDETKILPVAMTINNKGYIIGGSNTNTVWVYDPELDKWEESENKFRDVGVYAGIGFNIGDRYFLGGGHTRENMEVEPVKLTDFYEYVPLAENWADKASVDMFESYYLSSFSLGNRGYVLDYDMLWEYNPNEDENEWYSVSDFPNFAKRLFPTIVSINNMGYLFGGANNPEEDLYSWFFTVGYDYNGWEYYNDLWVYVPPAGFQD
jgi:N-acetylneuraminic acid mutarotase